MKIEWYKLTELAADKFRIVPSNAGVYIARWAKEGGAVPIGRLGGCDQKGILYVGSAKNLTNRIRRLWRGISGGAEAHTIRKTILFCKVFEAILPSEYEVTWEKSDTHDEAKGQEWSAIRTYAERYKEPPPLNLGLQREHFVIWGIARWGKSRWPYEPDDFVRSAVV
jgi:hypothetical protein